MLSNETPEHDYPRLGVWRERFRRTHYTDAGDRQRIGIREVREYVPHWLERLACIECRARVQIRLRDECRLANEIASLRAVMADIERHGTDFHNHYKARKEAALAELWAS